MGGVPAPRPNVEVLVPYKSSRRAAAVLLDANEAACTARPIKERLEEVVSSIDLNRYPSRERAAEASSLLGSLHGVSGSEVVIGNGSNEILLAIHLAFGGPSRRAVYFDPTYTVYKAVAGIAGTEAVALERDEKFEIPSSSLEQAQRVEPSIIHLCSPNNPTGNEDPPEFALEVASAFPEALVVVDRAYGPFGGCLEEAELLRKPNVVIVRTFSKAAGLAGLRIGYGLASSRIADILKTVLLPYNLDAVSIEAVTICVEEVDTVREHEVALAKERDQIYEALRAYDSLVAYPSAANFVLFGPKGAGLLRRDRSFAEVSALNERAVRLFKGVLERSVLLRDCTQWPGLVGCLRVSAGSPSDTAHFVEALDATIARIDL